MTGNFTVRAILTGVVCLALCACASVGTVPAGPFQQFHASVVQLGASADQALAAEQELTYQRYIHTVADTRGFDELQLHPDTDGAIFDMNVENVPLYGEIRATRKNLADMNALVGQYAEFLLAIAGAAENSPGVDATGVADALRTNATALAETLQVSPDLDNGWFFGFGVIAEAYVESRRREALVDLLRSADDEMNAFAQLGQMIASLSAGGIQAEYLASFSRETAGAGELDEQDRRELVADVLELNAQTLHQLETLRQLRDAYGALPGAHLQLQTAVASGTAPSASSLLAYAQSLRDRYRAFDEE